MVKCANFSRFASTFENYLYFHITEKQGGQRNNAQNYRFKHGCHSLLKQVLEEVWGKFLFPHTEGGECLGRTAIGGRYNSGIQGQLDSHIDIQGIEGNGLCAGS